MSFIDDDRPLHQGQWCCQWYPAQLLENQVESGSEVGEGVQIQKQMSGTEQFTRGGGVSFHLC